MNTVETLPGVIRKITKAKLTKSGCLYVEYQKTEIISLPGGKTIEKLNNETSEGLNMPHPDMLDALNLMRGHLAILCSQLDGKKPILEKIEDDSAFIELFKVTGFSIGGNGDTEGVTLTGTKKIKRGILNIVTPFTRFMDDTNPYEYEVELAHLVAHATDEANLYLDDKIAPDAQGKIDFNNTGDEQADLE